MDFDIRDVQRLVGDISYEQMKDVDAFVSDNVALFTPSTGPCKYAVTKDHTHPAYSFILLFDNYCKIIIEDKEINPDPGEISAFSPDVIHHEDITDEFNRYVAIMIDKDFFENQVSDYFTGEFQLLKGDIFKSTNELRNYLKDFMIEYKNRLPGYQKVLEAIGLNITHSLIRIILNYDSSKQEIGSRININNAIEYMHANYSKKLSLEELSFHASLSTSHFSRIFKKETGKSPLDYLIHLRLEKAKKLLLSSNRSITEIAFDTGFNSSAHFASSFTQHFNITPSEFKKSI